MADPQPLSPVPSWARDILDSLLREIDREAVEARKYDRPLDLTWKVREALGRACAEAYTAGYVDGSGDATRQRLHRDELDMLSDLGASS